MQAPSQQKKPAGKTQPVRRVSPAPVTVADQDELSALVSRSLDARLSVLPPEDLAGSLSSSSQDETDYLLSSPANAEHLMDSVAQLGASMFEDSDTQHMPAVEDHEQQTSDYGKIPSVDLSEDPAPRGATTLGGAVVPDSEDDDKLVLFLCGNKCLRCVHLFPGITRNLAKVHDCTVQNGNEDCPAGTARLAVRQPIDKMIDSMVNAMKNHDTAKLLHYNSQLAKKDPIVQRQVLDGVTARLRQAR